MIPPANMSPDAPSPSPSSPAAGETLVRRLARLRRKIFDASSRATQFARKTTPSDLRRTSADFRRVGDLTAAEQICSQAIATHPADLGLAIEHAEIARAAKDVPLRILRWRLVIDLGGDQAPACAFEDLASCHPNNPATAEAYLREGLKLRPTDCSLLRKLGNVFAAQGRNDSAIDAWSTAIAAHPKKQLAAVYSQISKSLREEGLLYQAESWLHRGAAKYPGDTLLRSSLADLAFQLATPSRHPLSCDPHHPATTHLFQDHFKCSAKGILAFSTGTTALRRNVPTMLDFAEVVSGPTATGPPGAADAFAVWGTPHESHLPVRETAAAAGKPLLCLEAGFLGFPGLETPDAAALSVIVTPDTFYHDATCPSRPESLLNTDTFALTDEQQLRAETCAASIIETCLSKFNHAPRMDLRSQFPADGTRRVLLIDQRKGGSSIHWSLGGHATFIRMWEAALAMPGYQILVKIHPAAIADHSRSHLAPLLPDPLPVNVVLIDYDVNPHDLLKVADQVFVCSSQLGFEAVMAGKEVHCFAAPYYAGWGFTHDEVVIPRRRRQRTPAEVFHLYHIVYSRYFVPGMGVAEIEDLIAFLASSERSAEPDPAPTQIATEQPISDLDPLKILIIIPNHLYGPTGRYTRDIGAALTRLGCQIMVLCDGPCPAHDSGIRWLTLSFEGARMSAKLRKEIIDFAPHFIYENGVRSTAQRAALEAVALTGARFALHSEDDDVQVHISRKGRAAAQKLVALDHSQLTTAEIEKFLREVDWKHSLHVLLDPKFDRWVEPLVRVLCYRMASFHTAVWYPFAERLAREYQMPTLIVPPVASPGDFVRIPLTAVERERVLQRYGIGHEFTVIFINGSLYSYSPEYALFLDALNLTVSNHGGNFALVIVSGRSALPTARMARDQLDGRIAFADLGVAEDDVYMEMLKACDLVCSPGLPDTFNRYRLPSRLVKAMAMAKPILTCRCGFGESLEHGKNAFLMEGEDPADWTAAISLAHDPAARVKVGSGGRDFAHEHFDAHQVATALKHRFEQTLREPPQGLAKGIEFSADDDTRPRPKIRLRSRYHSALQPAIHALALQTHRLETVVHIGAEECDELEDYCRLGARKIVLSQGAAETIGNFAGTIATADGQAALPIISGASCNLLVIAEESKPENVFHNTPVEVLRLFRWIIARNGNSSADSLAAAGFHTVPMPIDHTREARHSLFEQPHSPTSFT